MNKYLNTTITCDCGREHKIPIKEIIIKDGALKKVPDLINKLSDNEKIYLICDKNTLAAAGQKVHKICEQNGFKVKPIVLKDDHVEPDTSSFFKILSQIETKGYLVACGSGTLNDLTKYISCKLGRPYMVVATAPSMDGYASSVAPITVDGVKNTFPAVPPEAIVADLSVLKEAPWKMIQAGFGDLLGKNTSLLDWKLSNILFDEYYCKKTVDLVKNELDKIMEISHKLNNRDQESIETLIKGLINSGLAMLMIGTSRPASGSEHHISHFLDMYGLLYNQEIPPHGVKVGLGTYFTSSFYLKLKEIEFSSLKINNDKQIRRRKIKENYKERSKSALDNLEQRWKKEQLTRDKLIDKEEDIKKCIEENSQNFKQIKKHLSNIGILQREDVKNLKKEWLAKAIKIGFEIRNRYSVSTLLKQTGLLDKWSEDLLEQF